MRNCIICPPASINIQTVFLCRDRKHLPFHFYKLIIAQETHKNFIEFFLFFSVSIEWLGSICTCYFHLAKRITINHNGDHIISFVWPHKTNQTNYRAVEMHSIGIFGVLCIHNIAIQWIQPNQIPIFIRMKCKTRNGTIMKATANKLKNEASLLWAHM